MYDRYTITSSREVLENTFNLKLPSDYAPSFNAAPTHRLPVILQKDNSRVCLFQWGYISKLSNNKSISPKLFNLPAGNAFSRQMYRQILQFNRCVILADGFYTWKQIGKKQKVPYFCYLNKRQPFGIAGVWEADEDLEGNALDSFNMLTVSATHQLREYQEDMPALLKPEEIKQWLQSDTDLPAAEAILKQISARELQLHAVSPLLNNATINDDRLIKPAPPSDQFGNYTLFN